MHQRIVHDGAVGRAYPTFGLNAPNANGVMTVTARCEDTEASVYLAILPFAPGGAIQPDQTIIGPEPTGSPTVALTLVSEGGICIDGINVRDMAYVYVGASDSQYPFTLDVSFTPVISPVEVV